MTLYILHIDPPFHHARHYIGFTTDADPKRRVSEHLKGLQCGSPLVRAALAAGHEVTFARTLDGDRTRERQIKRWKNTSRFCPICNPPKRQCS